MLAGPAIALVVVQPVSGDSLVWLLVDGAVVALAANTANLFDRAPGRVTKLALVSFAALLVSALASTGGRVPSLLGVGVALGAALALLAPELREELMLGDTGANALWGRAGSGGGADPVEGRHRRGGRRPCRPEPPERACPSAG